MSRQPPRVTSGQSNSGHKQIHISKLFSHYIYIYQPSVKSVYKTNQFANKTYIHKHQTQIFEVSPFHITPVKRAQKAGIVDHSEREKGDRRVKPRNRRQPGAAVDRRQNNKSVRRALLTATTAQCNCCPNCYAERWH